MEADPNPPGALEKRRQLPNFFRAIGLLAAWSKWLITIETAAIGFIGVLVKDGNIQLMPSKIMIVISLVAFLISIFAAGAILRALVSIAQRPAQLPDGEDIYHGGMWMGGGRQRIWHFVFVQQWTSVVGLLALVGAIISELLGHGCGGRCH